MRQALILLLICTASFMNVLDVTVVSVALPDMGAALGASLSELQWVVNAYTLPLGTLLMSAATLSGSVGRLRLFRWGVVLFTAGSLVCALAPSVGVLDWSRFIQGVGGAIFLGVGVPMISDRYQAGSARARAIGVYGAVSGAAIALGPLLGGGLVLMAGWRSIFWVNVPVGLAVWLGSRWVPEVGADRGDAAGKAASGKVDWPGTVLCVAMTGALTLALLQGNTWGWASPVIVSLLAGSAVLLAAFCLVERRSASPMVDVSILTEPTYAGSVLVGFIIQAALIGPMAFLSLYAQNIYRLTPAQTGLCFLPFSASALIVAATCGGAVRRHGARASLLGIVLGGVVGSCLLMLLRGSSTWLVLIPGLVLAGAATGATGTIVNQLAVSSADEDTAGMTSGFSASARQLGIVMGVAVMGVSFERVIRSVMTMAPQIGVLGRTADRERLISLVASGKGLRALDGWPTAMTADMRSHLAPLVRSATDAGLSVSLGVGAAVMLAIAIYLALTVPGRRAKSEVSHLFASRSCSREVEGYATRSRGKGCDRVTYPTNTPSIWGTQVAYVRCRA